MQHLQAEHLSVSPMTEVELKGWLQNAACCSTLSRLGLASIELAVCISISMVRQRAEQIDPITDHLPGLVDCATEQPLAGSQRSVSRISSTLRDIRASPLFMSITAQRNLLPAANFELLAMSAACFQGRVALGPRTPTFIRVRAKSHAAASASAPAPAKGPVLEPSLPRRPSFHQRGCSRLSAHEQPHQVQPCWVDWSVDSPRVCRRSLSQV